MTMTQVIPPVATRKIPVCTPALDGREAEYVAECLRGTWISSMGEFIGRFERSFAGIVGAPHAVACNSGTSALHLAFESLGIGPGDEVIIPSFTLVVSANTVLWAGATPVLVDVRPDTWCIDPRRIEERITPRTKAIVAVHMYGHPCDMDAIMQIAARHGLHVIEDAAQAHGATYRGRMCGSIGDVGCFSFYANKILTTGEGGMVVTRHQAVADRAALLRNQAFGPERFVHHDVGFNYRMTNVQAAIGLAQCERFRHKVDRKLEIARRYRDLLDGVAGLEQPVELPSCRNVYWMYGLVLTDEFGATKDEVRDRLADLGVETRSFFIPIHRQPVFQGQNPRWPDLRGDYPISDRLGRNGFYLPTGPGLTEADQRYVVEALLSCRR